MPHFGYTGKERIQMKKWTALILFIVICLQFSACSDSNVSSAEPVTTTKKTTASSDANAPTSGGLQVTRPTETNSSTPFNSGTASTRSRPESSRTVRTTVSAATSKITTAPTTSTLPRTVRVTIPEGYSLSQIGDLLEKNGVCKKSELLATANSYDFTYYPLVAKIPDDQNRCFRLEGYLFPNTYEFYRNDKPQDALGRMLRGSRDNIGDKYRYPGMTTDQLVILASLIEKEASRPADMKLVSSVFHNRLKDSANWPYLNSDPTIDYVEKYLKPNISGNKDRYNTYYNTYKCVGLPVGPICNPGANALAAAAQPADSDYYYFCANKQTGEIYYAKTAEEHEANLVKAGLVSSQNLPTP